MAVHKNQFRAAYAARVQIGSPFADVPSSQVAFGLLHPITLGLTLYIDRTTGALVLGDGTTPAISLPSGKTNTGTITISGKTSGALIITTADATAQNVTLKALAQTSGAGILQIPDLVGATDTLALLAATQTLTNKTLTGNINADTKYCSTQLDKTTSTALADITGLTGITLVAGATYEFEIFLAGTSGASGGWKVAFNYTTATLTSLESTAQGFTAAAVATQHTTTTTTQTSLLASTALTIAARISGRMVVNAAGTLAVQFAQNVSDGTTCSIFVGSKARFTRTA